MSARLWKEPDRFPSGHYLDLLALYDYIQKKITSIPLPLLYPISLPWITNWTGCWRKLGKIASETSRDG
jgi:hypothetical protein